jgi:hypothetical protein
MWKPLVVATLVVFALSSCSMWKNPPKGWSGATGGEQLERQLWSEIKAKNWSELEKHLAPLFVANSANATHDRAAAVARWKQFDLQSVSLADIQVQPAGTDFVVTATVSATGTIAGNRISAETFRTMTVWQQSGNGWVAIAQSDPLQ